jgi:hypothetical protein
MYICGAVKCSKMTMVPPQFGQLQNSVLEGGWVDALVSAGGGSAFRRLRQIASRR